ncbi:MAG: ABC transporter permease, partial [Lachnospiraceae bacterium]
NILLTIFGIASGIVLGLWLHHYVIQTVEVDMLMFGQKVRFLSYVYSSLFTILFSVIVNVSMYFKLKKIDMIESLKSVE